MQSTLRSKRLAITFGLVLAAIGSAVIADAHAASPRERIVCYGTSLTANGAWVSQLQGALHKRYPGRVEVINSGGSGQYSKWGVDNLQRRVIDKKPTVVLIEFAMNDAVDRFKCSVKEARGNLENMIDRIQKALPRCRIALQVMNPAIEKNTAKRANLQDYYQMYRDVAAERKLLLIDHGPTWQALLDAGKDKFFKAVPDGVHPTPEACGKYVTPTVLKALSSKSSKSTASTTTSATPATRASPANSNETYDLVVYGQTSAGVIAAVQAKRMGKTVILTGPDTHLGGLSSGGLGSTDIGNKRAIGGLSREFYKRVGKHYGKAEMWKFEPHVAEKVFEGFVADHKIEVHRDEWLNRAPGKGVQMEGGRIVSITMLSGKTYRGKMFIDATYEGDLMAAAGVSYTFGREANSQYGETLNGVATKYAKYHQFAAPVDPYVKPGDPSSGLLPGVMKGGPGEEGSADKRIQAYNFRMCLTDVPANRVPFPKPEGYDPIRYELLLRTILAGANKHSAGYFMSTRMPNGKTDSNNSGPFSTDNIGMNYDYPDGDYATRKRIIKDHETYQKGLMWFLSNDPRVPENRRAKTAKWGLPKDEFKDNGHWPHQLYIREARRMVGSYVMTQLNCQGKTKINDSVGMGAYTMDSHHTQRYVDDKGHVRNEGDVQVGGFGPYPIAYGSIVPKKGECDNLLVPVCLSATHMAFGSIRMEPVFMVLGQSAATAAAHAIDDLLAVQDVGYAKLRTQLLTDKQVLE